MSERPLRGRPREFDGTPVSVRLPKVLHDEMSIEALQRRMDLSDVIRERLFVSQKSQSDESASS